MIANLLKWFRANRRDLSWRRDRDPYRIWVSEIMLQQTQVKTVQAYFDRFLEAFPTVADLAAADEQEVLRLWEGLGYYRRACNLHQAARQLAANHGGSLPDDPEVWRRLPGIGRYTLGAILSQAFDRRLPVVEANSQRVLCRLFGNEEDPRRAPVRKWLWETAEALLPQKNVGDFNQALMELGALVCTPTEPQCSACPLRRECVAHRRGLQDRIPHRSAATPTEAVRETAVVLRRGSRVLLAQRPTDGRWAGLWEFPHGPIKPKEESETAALRLLCELTGMHGDLEQRLPTIKHSITRFAVTVECFAIRHRRGRFQSAFYPQGRWLKPEQLPDFPVSSPQRTLARFLETGVAR